MYEYLLHILGKIPAPNGIGVVTSQHALEGFFSSLREELIMAKKNISITICSMGLIGEYR